MICQYIFSWRCFTHFQTAKNGKYCIIQQIISRRQNIYRFLFIHEKQWNIFTKTPLQPLPHACGKVHWAYHGYGHVWQIFFSSFFFSLSRDSWRCWYKSWSDACGWTGITAHFKSCCASCPTKLQSGISPKWSLSGKLKEPFLSLVRKCKTEPREINVHV